MSLSQSMSISHDDYMFLVDIMNKYHQKNISQALHILIKTYCETIKYAAKLKQELKPTNELPEKYQMKQRKPSNPMVDL